MRGRAAPPHPRIYRVPPPPRDFLHPSKKLLPTIVISSHMEEKRSFEEFKRKYTFFVSGG